MVTIRFKLSSIGKVEIKVGALTTWGELLKQCAATYKIEVSAIIAVRNSKVLTVNDIVSDGDQINVFPAISGG